MDVVHGYNWSDRRGNRGTNVLICCFETSFWGEGERIEEEKKIRGRCFMDFRESSNWINCLILKFFFFFLNVSGISRNLMMMIIY